MAGLHGFEAASRGDPLGSGWARGVGAAQLGQQRHRANQLQNLQLSEAMEAKERKLAQQQALQTARQKAFGSGAGAEAAGPFAELAAIDPQAAQAVIASQLTAANRAPPAPSALVDKLNQEGLIPGTPEWLTRAKELNDPRAPIQINTGMKIPSGYRPATPEEKAETGAEVVRIPGVKDPAAEAFERKSGELARQFDPALDAVDRLEALVDQYGTEGMGPFSDQTVVGQMGPLYQQVISALGLLSKSGTIQPSEVDRFATSLPDPTSFASAIRPGSVARLKGGLKTLRDSLKTARTAFQPIGSATEKAPEGAFDFGSMTMDQLRGMDMETIETFTDAQAEAYADRLEALMRQ